MARMFRNKALSITAGFLASLVMWASPARAQQAGPPALFRQARAPAHLPQLGPEVVGSRAVAVDLRLLEESTPGQRMKLSFPGNREHTGVVVETAASAPRQRVLRGTFETATGSFLIVQFRDAIAGVFRLPGQQKTYRLRSAGKGAHLVLEVDIARYPPEECFRNLPKGGQVAAPAVFAQPETAGPIDAEAQREAEESPQAICAERPTVLDVMLVYTPAARIALGGTHEAAIAECHLAIAVGNQAYGNSLIDPRLRLVHCTEVARTEAGDMDTDLDWLTSAAATQVHADRETYGADFVSMIVSYGSGLGWCGGGEFKAYSVVAWDRAAITWSLAHEIGHNQGCDHNREDAKSGCHAASYSYGYYFVGNSGFEWGTIMSYPGTRVAHFSNPNVLYDGQPTGVPIGDEGESYNVRTINNLASWHEDYRLTRYDIWVDLDALCLFGICDGTFDTPYVTLASAVAEVPVAENPSELPNLWIKSSASDETLTIDKPLTLRACSGAVTVGR